MKRSELFFSAILVPIDFCMLVVAGMFAYFIRVDFLQDWRPVLFKENLPLIRYFWLVVAIAVFWVLIFAVIGLYKLKVTRSLLEEFSQVFVASSAGVMSVIVYIFLKREWFDSRFLVLAAWFLAITAVILGRLFIRLLQRYLVSKYRVGVHRVLVIGDDSVSKAIINNLASKPFSGYEVVKHLASPDLEKVIKAVNYSGVDEVVLANPDFPRDNVLEIIDFCDDRHIVFKFVPNLFQSLTTNTEVDVFTGIPLVELKQTALDGWGRITKRFMDIVGSLAGIITLAPFFVLVGLAVKWESEGPIFIKQERISQGKKFILYKFRSMVKNAEELKKDLMYLNERNEGPLFKIKDDPRITKVGRFIRKTRIDEFPQLFNVLKGEMSLVGPRPHLPQEVSQYKKHHKKVLAIKAGLTGFAQISGSSDLPFEEEVKLDTYYLENWSLVMDIKIILKTVVVLFKDKSAC